MADVKVTMRVCDEALSLFAPLEPCQECGRPFPVPFEGDYQHWDGCSVGEAEEMRGDGAAEKASPSVVVVGEVNPHGADPYFALYHLPRSSSGNRFRVIAGLSDADYLRCLARRNLCVGRWDNGVARRAAQELLAGVFESFVLLGRRVADAFRVSYGFQVRGLGNKLLLSLPHPSGRCRAWNEPGAVGRARELLRAHVPGVPWGSF